MANYTFETMTDAQALSYNGANDSLNFSDPNASNTTVKVQYVVNGGDATHAPSTTFVVTDTNEGLSRTFGPAAFPEAMTLQSGATVYAGDDTANSYTLSATAADAAFGGGGNDTLVGTANTSAGLFMQGNGGDDSMLGGTGNDTLFGGQGNDTIVVSNGNTELGHALVNGNIGNDTITGGAHGDTLYGGQGDDSIAAGIGNDLVNGNIGNDTITSTNGTDTLYGGQGDDSIVATGSNDLINGNIGNDHLTITNNGGHDTIHGGQGDDTIVYTATAAGDGASYIFGDLGNDNITVTSNFNDTISGGDGNDHITVTSAATGVAFSIDGGAGDNTISLTHGADTSTDSALSLSHADTITGGDGINTITLDFTAGSSNDTITATSNDLITTGAGNDVIHLNADASHVTVTGHDTINAGGGDNTVDVHAIAGGESIITGSGADTIDSGTGNDTISSGDGNDLITLHTDSSHVAHLTVGAGHDTIHGGDGQTIVTQSVGGNDVFDFSSHHDYTAGHQDQITGWNGGSATAPTAGDTITFGFDTSAHPVAALIDSNVHAPVTDYLTAMTEADYQFQHGYNVVAVQVGSDVVVFADTNSSGHLDTTSGGDTAVVLVGKSLTDVHTGNFVG